MGSVGFALLRTAWMGVHVGDDRQAPPFTQVPQAAEVTPVEPDDPGIEAMRVEVIIKNEIDNSGAPIRTPAKQERAALPRGVPAPPTQTSEKPMPQPP
jgi:hypothetical protein